MLAKSTDTQDLLKKLEKFWRLSGEKVLMIEREFDTNQGAPVFTINGKYASRGWTEWTQGFQYGSAIIQYEVSGDPVFLEIGRKATIDKMRAELAKVGK